MMIESAGYCIAHQVLLLVDRPGRTKIVLVIGYCLSTFTTSSKWYPNTEKKDRLQTHNPKKEMTNVFLLVVVAYMENPLELLGFPWG